MSLLKKFFSKKSLGQLKEQSRLDYEKAIKGINKKSSLGFRLRLANRAKVNIEKTFLEAVKLTEEYELLKESYLAENKSLENLELPRLVDPYQLISTDNGVVVSFIPEEYAEEIFKLGCSYQNCSIAGDKAISIGQGILDKICFELEINKEIDVLEFLATEDDEKTSGDVEKKTAPGES